MSAQQGHTQQTVTPQALEALAAKASIDAQNKMLAAEVDDKKTKNKLALMDMEMRAGDAEMQREHERNMQRDDHIQKDDFLGSRREEQQRDQQHDINMWDKAKAAQDEEKAERNRILGFALRGMGATEDELRGLGLEPQPEDGVERVPAHTAAAASQSRVQEEVRLAQTIHAFQGNAAEAFGMTSDLMRVVNDHVSAVEAAQPMALEAVMTSISHLFDGKGLSATLSGGSPFIGSGGVGRGNDTFIGRLVQAGVPGATTVTALVGRREAGRTSGRGGQMAGERLVADGLAEWDEDGKLIVTGSGAEVRDSLHSHIFETEGEKGWVKALWDGELPWISDIFADVGAEMSSQVIASVMFADAVETVATRSPDGYEDISALSDDLMEIVEATMKEGGDIGALSEMIGKIQEQENGPTALLMLGSIAGTFIQQFDEMEQAIRTNRAGIAEHVALGTGGKNNKEMVQRYMTAVKGAKDTFRQIETVLTEAGVPTQSGTLGEIRATVDMVNQGLRDPRKAEAMFNDPDFLKRVGELEKLGEHHFYGRDIKSLMEGVKAMQEQQREIEALQLRRTERQVRDEHMSRILSLMGGM